MTVVAEVQKQYGKEGAAEARAVVGSEMELARALHKEEYLPVALAIENMLRSAADPQAPLTTRATLAEAKADMSVHICDYLMRFMTYTTHPQIVYYAALCIVEHAQHCRPGIVPTVHEMYAILMTALVIATKFWDDHFYTNSYYARVVCIQADEMCACERALVAAHAADTLLQDADLLPQVFAAVRAFAAVL